MKPFFIGYTFTVSSGNENTFLGSVSTVVFPASLTLLYFFFCSSVSSVSLPLYISNQFYHITWLDGWEGEEEFAQNAFPHLAAAEVGQNPNPLHQEMDSTQ